MCVCVCMYCPIPVRLFPWLWCSIFKKKMRMKDLLIRSLEKKTQRKMSISTRFKASTGMEDNIPRCGVVNGLVALAILGDSALLRSKQKKTRKNSTLTMRTFYDVLAGVFWRFRCQDVWNQLRWPRSKIKAVYLITFLIITNVNIICQRFQIWHFVVLLG